MLCRAIEGKRYDFSVGRPRGDDGRGLRVCRHVIQRLITTSRRNNIEKIEVYAELELRRKLIKVKRQICCQ